MTTHSLSPEGQVIALLCSRLALPQGTNEPLTSSEWNALAGRIAASDWKTPPELLGKSVAELRRYLELDEPFAARIHALLARGGQFALALEQLADRGIWLLTRADSEYPARLNERLQARAPVLLFGAGRPELLVAGGVAVVGSRDADEESTRFAVKLGETCAAAGVAVISGAARGIDRAAMNAALENSGTAAGVLADSLERVIREPDCRQWILNGRLTLATPFHYSTPFSVGTAMARNKLVYCLADFAVVVAAGEGTGGTWAGALENLKAGWVPLFVRGSPSAPEGNRQLAAKGALAIEGEPRFGDLQATADAWEKSRAAQPATRPAADDFDALWPALQQFLAQPRTKKEIAGEFKLKPAQADNWIKRALAANLVEQVPKPKKPLRYVAAGNQPAETLALFRHPDEPQ